MQVYSTVCSNNDSAIVIHLYFWFFSFSRLSTKPGSVPSILKSHSFTAATEFLASNTVWRFRRGVPLYYQIMMMSSMEDYQVSSVQVQYTTTNFTCFLKSKCEGECGYASSINYESLKVFLIIKISQRCQDLSPDLVCTFKLQLAPVINFTKQNCQKIFFSGYFLCFVIWWTIFVALCCVKL